MYPSGALVPKGTITNAVFQSKLSFKNKKIMKLTPFLVLAFLFWNRQTYLIKLGFAYMFILRNFVRKGDQELSIEKVQKYSIYFSFMISTVTIAG